jgi:hypothetical protein
MRMIGIDVQFGTIYGDVGNFYREIVPLPIVCEAVLDPTLPVTLSSDFMFVKCVFREDHFDSTARLRRGRLYLSSGSQPSRCGVLPRTREDYEHSPRPRDMFTFEQYQLATHLDHPTFVVLGSSESLWRVLGRPERISTGEFLFTLKARGTFGILPEVDVTLIPEQGRKKVLETVETLTEAASRADPASVIDRARAAAQCCLATWAAEKYDDKQLLTKDLADIVKKVGRDKWTATRASEVVGVLHSNAKPNEQERYGSRAPMEDDAELAVKAVGLIIRELGWTRE